MAYFGGSATESSVPRVDRRVVVLALMMMLMAIALAYVVLNPQALQQTPPQPQIVIKEVPAPAPAAQEVFVAANTIWPGQKIVPELVKKEFRTVAGLEGRVIGEPSLLVNTYAAGVIPGDTPVLKELITSVPPANALTARIPNGYRAVTIAVNTESAIEGWVRPGVRVDVVWTTTQRDKRLVTTLVENVQVISAERSINPGNPEEGGSRKAVPSNITLLVDARDAQKVQLAKSSGTLSLNLRGDSDTEENGGTTVTFDGILRAKASSFDDVQGRASFDGKSFQIRAGKLVPEDEIAASNERNYGSKSGSAIITDKNGVSNASVKIKK